MTWGEALRLLGILRRDTASQFAAALEGWDFPVDRAYLATLDLYDLTVAANTDSKKRRPDPHPGRPFKPDTAQKTRRGNAGGRSPEQVKELLRQMARGEIQLHEA